MDAAIQEFFDWASKPITRQHLVEFCPGDPGHEVYIREWNKIVETGKVPARSNFDLSETIGLTGWAKPEEWDNSERFSDFRRFTGSVALMLIHQGNDSEIVHAANYIACNLLCDAPRSDKTTLRLVREVFSVTCAYLSADKNPDYPFFRFGELILSDWLDDPNSILRAARALVDDEQSVRTSMGFEGPEFLLGLTAYNQLHARWVEFARNISEPSSSDDLKLVIDSIVAG